MAFRTRITITLKQFLELGGVIDENFVTKYTPRIVHDEQDAADSVLIASIEDTGSTLYGYKIYSITFKDNRIGLSKYLSTSIFVTIAVGETSE